MWGESGILFFSYMKVEKFVRRWVRIRRSGFEFEVGGEDWVGICF